MHRMRCLLFCISCPNTIHNGQRYAPFSCLVGFTLYQLFDRFYTCSSHLVSLEAARKRVIKATGGEVALVPASLSSPASDWGCSSLTACSMQHVATGDGLKESYYCDSDITLWQNSLVCLRILEHPFQEKKSQSQNSIQHFEFSRTFFSTGSRAIAAQRAEWQAYQC